MTPHSRPSTLIGTPTAERAPQPRAMSAKAPEASPKSSIRAGLPVWNTSVVMFRPPMRNRSPIADGHGMPALVHTPTIAAVPSVSYRLTLVKSAATTRPNSSATAANTFPGGAASATSVATRRSATCSSAWRRRSTRACALAIAVPTSSVKPASRASASAGSRSPRVDADGHHAPQLAVDGNWRADSGAESPVMADLGTRAGGATVVVHPDRPAGLEHQRDQVLPA